MRNYENSKFQRNKIYDDAAKRDMESMKNNPEKKAAIKNGLKRLDEISGRDTVVLRRQGWI